MRTTGAPTHPARAQGRCRSSRGPGGAATATRRSGCATLPSIHPPGAQHAPPGARLAGGLSAPSLSPPSWGSLTQILAGPRNGWCITRPTGAPRIRPRSACPACHPVDAINRSTRPPHRSPHRLGRRGPRHRRQPTSGTGGPLATPVRARAPPRRRRGPIHGRPPHLAILPFRFGSFLATPRPTRRLRQRPTQFPRQHPPRPTAFRPSGRRSRGGSEAPSHASSRDSPSPHFPFSP